MQPPCSSMAEEVESHTTGSVKRSLRQMRSLNRKLKNAGGSNASTTAHRSESQDDTAMSLVTLPQTAKISVDLAESVHDPSVATVEGKNSIYMAVQMRASSLAAQSLRLVAAADRVYKALLMALIRIMEAIYHLLLHPAFVPFLMTLAVAVVLYLVLAILIKTTDTVESSVAWAHNVTMDTWSFFSTLTARTSSAAWVTGQGTLAYGGTLLCSRNTTARFMGWMGLSCDSFVSANFNDNLNNTVTEFEYIARVSMTILPASDTFQLATIPIKEQLARIEASDLDSAMKGELMIALDRYSEALYRAGGAIFAVGAATDQILTVLVTNLMVGERELQEVAEWGLLRSVFFRSNIEDALIRLLEAVDIQILEAILLIDDCIKSITLANQSGRKLSGVLAASNRLVDSQIAVYTNAERRSWLYRLPWTGGDSQELQNLHRLRGQLSQITYNTTELESLLTVTKIRLERHRELLENTKGALKSSDNQPRDIRVKSVLKMVHTVIEKLSYKREKFNKAYTVEYEAKVKQQQAENLYKIPDILM